MSNITLEDYGSLSPGQQISGDYSPQDVDMLLKAMSAEQITGRDTTNLTTASGAPLKVESLENTLKVLTNTPKHTPFYYRIPKKAATNTVEEYNQLVSYGELDGGFTSEGELPEGADSVYRRKAQYIKYLGIVGGVTHQMELVQTGSGVSNMLAQETKNKVMKMTALIESNLPFADSRKIPTSFNGFMTQHETESEFASVDLYQDSEIVIDLRGSMLSDEAIERATLGIVQNYGIGDMLITHPRVLSNYVTRYHNKKLINPVPQQVRDGVFGQRVVEIVTQNGPVETMQSNFFEWSKPKTTATLASNQKAPAAPVAGATPKASVVDGLNRFANFTGDYFYGVTARNRYGESAMTPIGTSIVSVSAGNSIDLQFTPGVGSPEAATCFNIYRSTKNPNGTINQTTLYKIMEVSAAELTAGFDGAAAGYARDRNRKLPNTDQAMLVEWDGDQVLAWKQLAPMMRMDLAIVAPQRRFMVLCYGTPILYAPKKMVRFINIGNVPV